MRITLIITLAILASACGLEPEPEHDAAPVNSQAFTHGTIVGSWWDRRSSDYGEEMILLRLDRDYYMHIRLESGGYEEDRLHMIIQNSQNRYLPQLEEPDQYYRVNTQGHLEIWDNGLILHTVNAPPGN